MRAKGHNINFNESAPTKVSDMKDGEVLTTSDGVYGRVGSQVLFSALHQGALGDGDVVMIGESTYDLVLDSQVAALWRMFGTSDTDVPGSKVFEYVSGDPDWYYADPYSIAYCGNGIFVTVTSDDLNFVLKSTDYGITWENKGEITGMPASSTVREVRYTGNGHIVVGIEGANLYWSDDYGETWNSVANPGSGETGVGSIESLGSGIVVAGTGNIGRIIRSTDYGETWSDRGQIHPQAGYVNTIVHLGSGHVLAGTSNNVFILRSADYGLTWEQVTDPNIPLYSDVEDLVYCGNGIVLGAGVGSGVAQFIRSTDYGTHWTIIDPSISSSRAYTVNYLGNGNLIAGCRDGQIIYSDDYGLTWDLVTDPLNPNEDGDYVYSIESTIAPDTSASPWTTTTTTTT